MTQTQKKASSTNSVSQKQKKVKQQKNVLKNKICISQNSFKNFLKLMKAYLICIYVCFLICFLTPIPYMSFSSIHLFNGFNVLFVPFLDVKFLKGKNKAKNLGEYILSFTKKILMLLKNPIYIIFVLGPTITSLLNPQLAKEFMVCIFALETERFLMFFVMSLNIISMIHTIFKKDSK